MTRYEDFHPVYGPDVIERHNGKMTEMGGFLKVLNDARQTVVPIGAAWAITANRLIKPDFTRLVNAYLERLSAAGKLDGLLLAMHGAQTAEGEDDVEGYFLGRVREILGARIPIIVSLDLHANITRAMCERATALVGYHTYPHIDMYETGKKAARLMLRTLSGKVNPVMAWRKLPLIVNAENQQTSHGPAHRLISKAQALEASGKAEAVSVFPVQPWMDIREMGSAVVVVADGKQRAAERHAAALAQKLWDTRRKFEFTLTPPQKAIQLALAAKEGPVVLSESSDSTGSGSPGDSTGVLKYLLKAPLTEPAAIYLVDPEAAKKLSAAGVGATVTLPIGGKLDRRNSKPVRVTGRVRLISDGRWTPRGRGYNTGIETSMGASVVFEVGQVKILIAEKAAMTVDPELFRSHGIDPLYCRIVVVKSPNGFRAAYEPIAKQIFVVDTPGVSTARLEKMPWRRVSRPIYPLDRGITYQA